LIHPRGRRECAQKSLSFILLTEEEPEKKRKNREGNFQRDYHLASRKKGWHRGESTLPIYSERKGRREGRTQGGKGAGEEEVLFFLEEEEKKWVKSPQVLGKRGRLLQERGGEKFSWGKNYLYINWEVFHLKRGGRKGRSQLRKKTGEREGRDHAQKQEGGLFSILEFREKKEQLLAGRSLL